MNATPVSLEVWVEDQFVCVKIAGRAGCACSVDFRTLVLGLREKGHKRFILDLTKCQLMDSTFLGVLAGLGIRFSEGSDGQPSAAIELLNPSSRISGLLENLGVAESFKVLNGTTVQTENLKQVDSSTSNPCHEDLQRTSLEAHQLLIQLNPKNAPKFKDVCKFLEEDLKAVRKQNGSLPSSTPDKPSPNST